MSEYLEAAFVSPFFQERFKATGSGLLHIHLVDLRAAALPVAPLEEQEVVTARAQDALRLLDAHAGRHSEIEAAVATLDRTTIAKAFRGELVRQDPNDEPAEAMLARVHPSNGSSSTTMHRRSTEHERDASHRMLGQTPSDAESRSKVSYRRRWPRG
jgi:type I restriction enzyme S subunit